jgi:RimJ/RimL family protein N-acetyltransferase
LQLREFDISDAKALYQLNADPEVMRFTGDKPFSSIAEAETFIQNYDVYLKSGFGRWAVIAKQSGRLIGWCGLKHNEKDMVDIGFRFFREEWGKGYATEAAKATLSYGFTELGLSQIIGRAARENKASLRVLEKLGMTYWKEDTCKGIANSLYYKIEKGQNE